MPATIRAIHPDFLLSNALAPRSDHADRMEFDDSQAPTAERAATPQAEIVMIHASDDYGFSLAESLEARGLSVVQFDDPNAAMWHFAESAGVGAVVVDVDAPRAAGLNVLLQLKGAGIVAPIAVVSSSSDETHEEMALEYGAADFFGKSRGLSVAVKRLQVLVNRRVSRNVRDRAAPETVTIGHLQLRLRSHRAQWQDRQVPLTVTEFKIVRLLASRAGEEVTYREIYDVVHGSGFIAGDGPQGFRSNVRSLIRKIRNRFRDLDSEFSEIENYPGFGYRWREPAAGAGLSDADVRNFRDDGKRSLGLSHRGSRFVDSRAEAMSIGS